METLEERTIALQMDCKTVKRKFNGADSLYIGQDEVSDVISNTPELQIESDHNISLKSGLRELETEIIALKSFVWEQFFIIKQVSKVVIYIYLNNHLQVKVRLDFHKKSIPRPIIYNLKQEYIDWTSEL